MHRGAGPVLGTSGRSGFAWARRSSRGPALALSMLVFLGGALTSGCKSKKEGPIVPEGARGVAPGIATDLRVAPGGGHAAFLSDPRKSPVRGVPDTFLQGALQVVSLDGKGRLWEVAEKVPNTPGGYLFGPKGRWLYALGDFDPSKARGTLYALDTHGDAQGDAEPAQLGLAVTYMLPSPDGERVAFVDAGTLRVGAPPEGPFADVARDVSTVAFSPSGDALYVRKRLAAGGTLERVEVGRWDRPRKLGGRVGEVQLSPQGDAVAFASRSEEDPERRDLFLAVAPGWSPRKVAEAADEVAFSPDGRWLAYTADKTIEGPGNVYLRQVRGGAGAGRKLGEKAIRPTFAPDSSGLAFLQRFSQRAGSGRLTVVSLSSGGSEGTVAAGATHGEPREIGRNVPNFLWGPEGHLAFLRRFFKPVYSVDLMLLEPDAKAPLKVQTGVYGYGFSKSTPQLLLRTSCSREGRACELQALDLEGPIAGAELRILAVGIYSFKTAEDAPRALVTYARTDSKLFDVAALSLENGAVKTIDRRIRLPAVFLEPKGTAAAYVVAEAQRAGVWVGEWPELPAQPEVRRRQMPKETPETGGEAASEKEGAAPPKGAPPEGTADPE